MNVMDKSLFYQKLGKEKEMKRTGSKILKSKKLTVAKNTHIKVPKLERQK